MKKILSTKNIVQENLNKKKFKRKLKSKKKKNKRVKYNQKNKHLRSSKYIPQSWLRKEVTLNVPSKFSLNKDLINVVDFIGLFKSYINLKDTYQTIKLDFSRVEIIDTPSISLLLSSIKELQINDINVEGNLPVNQDCANFLLSSGFLEHMSFMTASLKNRIRKSDPADKNMMIMSGKDKTSHREIGKIIKDSVKKLTGEESHYKSLYGVIGEMNINSLEHAYKKNKHWVFAVKHDKKNQKINFTFADNGFGIYKTLTKTFGLKAFSLLGLKNENEIVEGMFKEEYSSRFKNQFNRNKGLPAIRNLQIENKVDNLIVLTNKTFIDFGNKNKVDLKSGFSGTFYYWELSKETYERNFKS